MHVCPTTRCIVDGVNFCIIYLRNLANFFSLSSNRILAMMTTRMTKQLLIVTIAMVLMLSFSSLFSVILPASIVLTADAWTTRPILRTTITTTKEKTILTTTTLRSLSQQQQQYYSYSPTLSSLIFKSSPLLEFPFDTRRRSYDNENSITTVSSISKSSNLDSNSTSSNSSDSNSYYYIRPATQNDVDLASQLLADAFFKLQTNFLTYQYEKWITFLSLESSMMQTAPPPQQQRSLSSSTTMEASRYIMFVACCKQRQTDNNTNKYRNDDNGTEQIIGFAELDGRSSPSKTNSNSNAGNPNSRTQVYEKSNGSPYMCNLVVDRHHQRQRIGTTLIHECERQVQDWYKDDADSLASSSSLLDTTTAVTTPTTSINSNTSDEQEADTDKKSISSSSVSTITTKMSNSICLKVRRSNIAAVQMYVKLGYLTVWEEQEKTKRMGIGMNWNNNNNIGDDTVLVMRKQLTSLSSRARAFSVSSSSQKE